MRVSYEELKAEFKRVLLKHKVPEAKAEECAAIFADTTQTGTYSHGVNRFPRFIQQLAQGDIIPENDPERILAFGGIEQWDAKRGIGNLTAKRMMSRAMELADASGIGLVALKNANHWMRGGSYGWQAAEKGYVGVCWTNTVAVMPPWGGKDCRIGTNPIIIAVPADPPIMVDMSTSMFSYGMLEVNRLAGRQLPVEGGYDEEGNLTRDPAPIEKTRRLLPMGYWKGSGLSIVLDMMATLLANGLSVADVTTKLNDEHSVSQVFIAIAVDRLIPPEEKAAKLKTICEFVQGAERVDPNQPIRLPGREFPQILEDNKRNGIPVDDRVWEKVRSL